MKITLKSLTILAFAINSLLPLGTAQAGALELNEDFRTPMFGQPAPAFRTVLLPDGKYLLFWSTDTLTDQRTGAITRYLPDGSLDETFALSRTYKFVGAAASTDGGQVIVAATRYLYDSPITEIIRLNADGSIDPTFNINVADRTANIGVRAMVIQPDGKILVAGLFEDFAGTGQQKIVRLLANGTLDPSFTPPPFYEGETVGIMTKPVVLSDGKILIAGNFSFMGEGVARLHPDGSYDPAFWASGYTINAFSPVRGVILQDDGKIVLGGQLRVWFPKGGSVYVPLFRLEANGDPDMSYTHVTTLSAFARDLAAQPDGKILAANLHSVYRFNTDGSLDNSFTPPVLLNAALSLPSSPGAYTVNIQPDGQILIGGFFTDVNLPPGPPDGSEFGVARLNADGTLDPSLATSRRTGLETYPKSFARLFDGSTLVAFEREVEPAAPFNVGRLLLDGSFDASFSLSSSDPNSILTSGFVAKSLVPLTDGKFFISGTLENFAPGAGKFLPTGEQDTSFASNPLPTFQKAVAVPGGEVLLAAGSDSQALAEASLTRLLNNGSIDSGFQIPASIRSLQVNRGGDPTSQIQQMFVGSHVVAVQPDGKILYAYLLLNGFRLVRLNMDGSLDNSFAGGAFPAPDVTDSYPIIFDPVLGQSYQPWFGVYTATNPIRDAEVLSDGRILIAGSFTSFYGRPARGMVRLHANGMPDDSFNVGLGAQWTETTPTPSFVPTIEKVEVQNDGWLLVTGTFEAFNDVALPGIASLTPYGAVDTSFTPVARRQKYARGTSELERQPDGSFLLSGPYSFPNETEPALIHIRSIPGVPQIVGPTTVSVITGQVFQYQIVASNLPTNYSASGLPPGFSVDSATGVITGSPTAANAGVYTITLVATNAEGASATFQLTLTVVLSQIGDFNRDGFTDFLLFHSGTRRTAIWNLQGAAFLNGVFGPTLPAGWVISCVADMNLDSKTDYVLFNPTTRRTAIWFLDNATLLGSAYGPTLPAGWSLIAARDINSDTKRDYILFNGSTRQTAVWYLNGTALSSTAFLPSVPAGWTLSDAIDFNDDSKPDLLLTNNTTRQTALWYLNGTVRTSTAFGPTIPAGWTLQGAADFSADDAPDYVLYQTSTRKTALWYLNGPSLAGSAYGPTLAAGYLLAAP